MLWSTVAESYEKMRAALTLFSPDIVLLIFKASTAMLDPTVILYIYFGMCHNMYDSDLVCDTLSEYPDHQDAVQIRSSNFLTWYRFLTVIPVLGLTLFVGSWSDKVGRKLVMVMPCLGTVLAAMLFLVSTIFIKQGYYLPMVLCGAIIRGMFGGDATLMMAVNSCVSDMTFVSNRTWRFSLLYAMNYIGKVLGYIIVGIVLHVSSFVLVFTVAISLQAMCVFWILLFVQDIKTADDTQDRPKAECMEEQDKAAAADKSLFRIQHIRDTWDVIAKKRFNAGRLHLVLLMIAVAVNVVEGEVKRDIVVLFVQRRPLSWLDSMYGYLAATDNMCMGLVSFVLPLLSYRYKVPDMYLVILGVGFEMLGMLLLGFSIHTWMVYVAIVSFSLIAIAMSAVRSLMSKIVEDEDTGKLFSIVSLVECVAYMLGSLLFTQLYAVTVEIFAGLSFHVASLLCLILLGLMMFLAKDMLSRPSYGTLQEDLDSSSADAKSAELRETSLIINKSSARQHDHLADSEEVLPCDDDDKLALTKDLLCNGVKSYHSIQSEQAHKQSSSQ